MPSLPLDLHTIINAASVKTKVNTPHYFLSVLGTNTKFTAKPTKGDADAVRSRSYENGETLSYIAQLAANRLGEDKAEIDNVNVLSFMTPSVAVINGPDTTGDLVGERIVLGLFLLLKAIAEGKEQINISAHSRGAVQSILIAHELERIKTELKSSDRSLYTILKNSSCTLTQKAAEKYFKDCKDKETPAMRKALFARLNKAKLNLFLIDPVPGGGVLLNWNDPRFYNKLPCDRAELIICQHERTKYFYPLLLEGISPLLVPGHHGTASGNIYTQQKEIIPAEVLGAQDTSFVQRLVVHKLIEFLNKKSNLFNDNNLAGNVALEHPVLDDLANDYKRAEPEARTDQLLNLYQSVYNSMSAYQYFTKMSYNWFLGVSSTASGSRWVYNKKANLTGLDEAINALNGHFVNMEHVRLYLAKEIKCSLSSQGDILERASNLNKVLKRLLSSYTDKASANANDQKIITLLDKPDSRALIFDALATYTSELCQAQLRDHLTVESKTQLLQILDDIFNYIDAKLSDEPSDSFKQILTDCKDILHNGIAKVTETHFKSLINQSDSINTDLAQDISQESALEALTTLNHLYENIENLINGKKHVELLVNGTTFESELIDAQNALAKERSPDPAIELDEHAIQAALIRVEDLQKRAFRINIEQLEMHNLRIIKRAAEILKKHENYLMPELSNLHPTFLKLITHHSIALKALEPGIEVVVQIVKANALSIHEQQIREKDRVIAEQQSNINRLQEAHQVDQTQLKKQKDELKSLSTTYESSKTEIEQLKQRHKVLADQLKSLQDDKLDLENKHKKSWAAVVTIQKDYDSALKQHQQEIAKHHAKNSSLGESILKFERQITELSAQKTQFESQLKRIKTQVNNPRNTLESIKEDDLEKEIKILKLTIDEQNQSIQQLKKHALKLKKSLTNAQSLMNNQDKLIQQLKSSKEIACAELIEKKLKPLTHEYWVHLKNKAQKLYPQVSIKAPQDNLPDLPKTASADERQAYEKIVIKYTIIQQLWSELNNSLTPLPSEKVTQFTTLLKNKNMQLKQHRDPMWMQYLKNCLVAIGVIASLIIPGVAALLAYSTIKQKSSPMFFAKSQGEEYIDKISNELSCQMN